MSQLSEYRRKVLKKSQEALSTELGYQKWQTYAAQESGRNPLPEDVKAKLRGKKFNYQGEWPDEEGKAASVAGSPYVTREDFAGLERLVGVLREDLEKEKQISFALRGAIRQLAKAAGLHHVLEQIE